MLNRGMTCSEFNCWQQCGLRLFLISLIGRHRRAVSSLSTICLLLASTLLSDAEAKAEKTLAELACVNFVERLIQDDYRALIEIGYVESDTWVNCKKAHELNPNNPVYSFGYAKTLELPFGRRTATQEHLDNAVKLLRTASAQDYEPAVFQLFRYIWQERMLEDPFLRTRYSLSYKIDDKPGFFIEKLKNSESQRITDFVLGYLVRHFKNPELAVKIAMRNVDRGSRKATFYLGLMHIAGQGVPRDKELGFAKLRDAALLGDTEAQVTYAHLTNVIAPVDEFPLKANFVEAHKFMTEAANGGDFTGFILLDSIVKQLLINTRELPEEEWQATAPNRDFLLMEIACNLNDTVKRRLLYFSELPDCDTDFR